MKAIVAYALLVIGIPQIVGVILGGVLTAPIGRLLHSRTNISLTNLQFLETINGVIAALAGAVLFRIFGLNAGATVPVIMAVWVTLYFFSYHQPVRAWISWLAGLLIGWVGLFKVFGI